MPPAPVVVAHDHSAAGGGDQALETVANSPLERQLRAVERLALVGTPREDRFDRLTRLARMIFRVPMANITLLDHDQFWVKSTAGMEDTSCYASSGSFCETAVRQDHPLVVEDATQDPRFASLSWVTGPSALRFYAGIPIRDANGIALGTFCLLDTEARHFGADQLAIFTELSDWVRQEMLTSTETTRARQVQQGLLPGDSPQLPGYAVAGVCIPSLGVGGDFFDWGPLGDGLGFTLSDVMGKGTGAAIMSATMRAAVRSAASRFRRSIASGFQRRAGERAHPVAIVEDVATTLQPDLDRTQTLVTAFFGQLSTTRHELLWADAGHGLAVVVGTDGQVRWLAGDDLPLGVLDASPGSPVQWTAHTTPLAPGDRFVVFSDGLPDLLGGDQHALSAIVEMIAEAPSVEHLVAEIRELTLSHVVIDDVTAVVVQRCPG